jgi:hypothetical protein
VSGVSGRESTAGRPPLTPAPRSPPTLHQHADDSDLDWTDQIAPSLDDFARLAEQAFADLPEEFRAAAGEVVFRIDDFADDDTLAHFGMEDPFELSGLYHGVDIGRRDSMGRRSGRRASSSTAARSSTNGASAATSVWPRSSPTS